MSRWLLSTQMGSFVWDGHFISICIKDCSVGKSLKRFVVFINIDPEKTHLELENFGRNWDRCCSCVSCRGLSRIRFLALFDGNTLSHGVKRRRLPVFL